VKDETGRGDTRMVRTVEYAADRPVRYLACVISRFVPVARQRAEVPAVAPVAAIAGAQLDGAAGDLTGVSIEVVATPLSAAKSRPIVNRASEMIRTFAKIVGEAPYPDFTIAAIEDNLPGGHSPPYFAMLLQPLPTSPFSWSQDPVAFETIYPHLFLAHEVAHQWWGHAVGWKNYHEQWLSEGLAQYFALLYATSDRGAEVQQNLLRKMQQSAIAQSSAGPIYLGYRLGHIQANGSIFRATVYNKSAVVLHMLRQLIGDTAFTAGLRRFYREHRFEKAGTDDLQRAFEAEAHRPLARFFERWVMGSSLPQLHVASRIDPSNTFATVTIEQRGDVFDMPVALAVEYANGTTETVVVSLWDAASEQRVPLKGPARRVYPAPDQVGLATFVR